jgi:anionic cell wall polymer biosynthesis LytR-Cps2A-Psr (LCP) family protein
MNLRKYILIFSIVATFFLTVSGIYLMCNIKYSSHESGGVLNKALKKFEPIKEPFNVLMLVIDKTSVNTDTMMVVNYNPKNSRISLLSIPRDTKVGLPKATLINGVYYNYDIKTLSKQITRLFDINIKYYASIEISTIRKTIDLLGGVKYTVPGKTASIMTMSLRNCTSI